MFIFSPILDSLEQRNYSSHLNNNGTGLDAAHLLDQQQSHLLLNAFLLCLCEQFAFPMLFALSSHSFLSRHMDGHEYSQLNFSSGFDIDICNTAHLLYSLMLYISNGILRTQEHFTRSPI